VVEICVDCLQAGLVNAKATITIDKTDMPFNMTVTTGIGNRHNRPLASGGGTTGMTASKLADATA
jgi:hypothetical protein